MIIIIVQVNVDLIGEDKVQVNCSQTNMHYLSNIELTVATDKENESISTPCRNDSSMIIDFARGTLGCGQLYTLQVYWVPNQFRSVDSDCIVGTKVSATIPCPCKYAN